VIKAGMMALGLKNVPVMLLLIFYFMNDDKKVKYYTGLLNGELLERILLEVIYYNNDKV